MKAKTKIVRKPKPWALQKIFFDAVVLNENNTIRNTKALFICRNCRHICDWDKDSDAYRCVVCGRKITSYGAKEILIRYESQLETLKKEVAKVKNNGN